MWTSRSLNGGFFVFKRPAGAVMSATSSAKTVSLANARDEAHKIRSKAKAGEDPVAVRRAGRVGVPTFEQCAKKAHAECLKKWRRDSKSSVQ